MASLKAFKVLLGMVIVLTAVLHFGTNAETTNEEDGTTTVAPNGTESLRRSLDDNNLLPEANSPNENEEPNEIPFFVAEYKKSGNNKNSPEYVLNPVILQKLSSSQDTILDKYVEDKYAEDLGRWVAPDKIRKEYTYYLSGHDDEDRPIWIAELGRWNLRKVIEEGGDTMKAFDKYVQQAAYRVVKSVQTKSAGENPVKDTVMIVDFENLNLVQLAHVPTMAYVLKLAQRYTPLIINLIDQGYILNTNFIAERMLNLLKPIMGRVIEKCEIYGNNRAKWVPKLLKRLPKSQIPQWYGGEKDFKPLQVYG